MRCCSRDKYGNTGGIQACGPGIATNCCGLERNMLLLCEGKQERGAYPVANIWLGCWFIAGGRKDCLLQGGQLLALLLLAVC